MKNITSHDFAEEVLLSELPVVVDFWAEWCGPCRMVAPILEELSVENTERFKVVKVNSDDNSGLAAHYSIRSIPTILILKGGEVVKTIIGAKPKAALLKEIEEVL
jgi:thioredoxin 1